MSGIAAATSNSELEFGHVIPILCVSDLKTSLYYYTRVLGFEVQWQQPDFAGLCRGKASVMFCEGGQGHPGTWLWLSVSDADALHDDLLAKGAKIRHPPTNYPWGSREVHVFDPDGHVLRFGSDLKPGEPMGEWLDSKGIRWAPLPDGGWQKVE